MHNVLIIFYIAFSIGKLFILPEPSENSGIFHTVTRDYYNRREPSEITTS